MIFGAYAKSLKLNGLIITTDWAEDIEYSGKPKLQWIEPFTKADGTEVKGHYQTEANETIADNLGTDLDKDGIAGFFDSDANWDGIDEVLDIDNDGIADGLEGLMDLMG